MGNTVGSANTDFYSLVINKEVAYIIGLWCADGYHRTSSIGLSNVDVDLIGRFRNFFLKRFPEARIKTRIYLPGGNRRQTAYHLYVNCRPLLRLFRSYKENIASVISDKLIFPYLAGRFDGDGSVASDGYRDCRIVYGNRAEAERDLALIHHAGFERTKLYHYRAARTFCLYVSRFDTPLFLRSIKRHSVRLQKSVFVPRRDLIATNVA